MHGGTEAAPGTQEDSVAGIMIKRKGSSMQAYAAICKIDSAGNLLDEREVREGGDVCIWLRLIHAYVRQKPTQYGKAIILQLKINKLKKRKGSEGLRRKGSVGRTTFGTQVANLEVE